MCRLINLFLFKKVNALWEMLPGNDCTNFIGNVSVWDKISHRVRGRPVITSLEIDNFKLLYSYSGAAILFFSHYRFVFNLNLDDLCLNINDGVSKRRRWENMRPVLESWFLERLLAFL